MSRDLSPNVPTVEILLDRPRRIALTLRAMKLIQRETGSLEIKAGDGAAVIENLGVYIWACLVDNDEGLTVEDVETMIHPGNMREITEGIERLASTTAGSIPKRGNDVPAPAATKQGKRRGRPKKSA